MRKTTGVNNTLTVSPREPDTIDGVLLSHNEHKELLADGLRAINTQAAETLQKNKTDLQADDLYMVDFGLGRAPVWVCKATLLPLTRTPEVAIQPIQQKHLPHLHVV